MQIVLDTPGVDELSDILGVLREWQHPGAPIQLHPGDIGWFWRAGAEATAEAVRTWTRGGQILAVGLLDGPDLLRLAIAPDAQRDQDLAQQLVADLSEPKRGVLPPGEASVESPIGALVHDLLGDDGWETGEPWTLLRRDLSERVENPALRIAVVGPDQAPLWSAVHRSAFRTELTEEQVVQRWHALAAGLPYADARSLVGLEDQGNAVAAVTVWSAGPSRYGVLEPMGYMRSTGATAMARQSVWPRPPHFRSWDPRPRSFSRRARMSGESPPTPRLGFSRSGSGETGVGPRRSRAND